MAGRVLSAFVAPLLFLLFSPSAFAASDAPQTFTLDGQFFQSGTTTPLLDTAAKVTIQILSDDVKCVLYEEEQTVDTHLSQGRFSIQVGSDTASSKRTTNDKTHPMALIFQNSSPITGNNAFGQNCAGGTYTPLAGHNRYFRLTIEPSATHIADTLAPDMMLDSVPNALVAETVQGLDRANILQVNNGGGVALTQPALEAMFTNPAYANLQKVMTGNFMQINANGAPLPVFASNPSAPTAGEVWYDSVANVMKYYNGTVVKTISATGSSVTSITGGTGLTGGTITAAGTLAVDVGTGANKILQLTSAAKIPAVDGSLLTNLPGITALTGDVTASGPGSAAATIANNAITAAKIKSTGGGLNRLLITDATTGLTVGYSSCGTNGDVLQWTASGWACASVSTFLGTSGVSAGTYGNANQVAQVTVDTQGRVTSLTNVNINFPVTSVNGKTGGAITLNGSDLGLGTASTLNYGTAPNNLVQLDTSSRLPAVDGSQLTNLNATRIGTRTISTAAPANGQVVAWNNTTSLWEPTSVAGGDFMKNGSVAMTGALQVVAGNVNAPGIGFVGDSDNGIFSPGTDLFAVTTNGVERVRIGATGNVGIGTTSGAQLLHVYASSGNANALVEAISNTNAAYFSAKNDLGTQLLMSMGGSALANTTLLTIPDSGRIVTTGAGGLVFDSSNASAPIRFGVGGATTASERMRIDAAGNVGIGTTSPKSILDINGLGTLQSAMIVPRDTVANRPASAVNGMIRYASDNGSLEGYVNGNWQAITTAGGSNNFSTDATFTGPGTGLAVTNTATVGGNLTVTGATVLNGGASISGGALNMNSQSITNVGAGVVGSGAMSVSAGGTNQNLVLSGSGTGSVLLNPNVGIGTASPTNPLEVLSSPNTITSGTATAIQSMMSIWPNSNSTAGYQSGFFSVAVGNNTNTGVARGVTGQVYNNNTGVMNQGLGAFNYIQNANTGTITDGQGSNNQVQNLSTGTITRGYGVYSSVTNTGGGTIGTGVGVYIDSIAGSSNYGLYQFDPANKNYFAGNVGIGTLTPSSPLDVVNATSQIHISQGGDVGGYLLSTSNSQAVVAGGVNWNGANWIAKSTSASFINQNLGTITFNTDSGLTAGNSFTPSKRMVIDSSGNVGIGTTTPGAILHVRSNIASTASSEDVIFRVESWPTGGTVDRLAEILQKNNGTASSTYGVFRLGNEFTNASTPTAVQINAGGDSWFNGGNLGIGTTTPGYNLHISQISSGAELIGLTVNNASNTTASSSSLLLAATAAPTGYLNGIVKLSSLRNASGDADFSIVSSPGGSTTPTTKMTILGASGNVGIGTSTPASILDVYGTGTLKSAMIVPRDTVANRPTSAVGGMIRYASDTNQFEAYANGNWQTLSTSGGVAAFTGDLTMSGAGTGLTVTNTEVIGGNLTVNGSVVTGNHIVNGNVTGGGAMTVAAGGTNQNLTLSGSGTGNVILSPNVGIGTTNPNGIVHAHNAAGAKSEFIATTGGTGSTTTDGVAFGINTGAAWLWNNENTPLEFATNNLERMRIDSAGNVGIGTTTPGATLDVQLASAAASGSANVVNSTLTFTPAAGSTATTRAMNFLSTFNGTGNSSGATTIGVAGTANNSWTGRIGNLIGINGYVSAVNGGTTDQAIGGQFQVVNTGSTITTAYGVNIGTVQGTNKWSLYSSDAAAPSYFAGNVGIGTANPGSKLDLSDTDTTVQIRITNRDSTAIRTPGYSITNFMGTGAGVGGYPMINMANYRSNAGGATSAVQSGDVLGVISAQGANGSSYNASWVDAIVFKATQNFTAANNGTAIQFRTIANNATLATDRMTIDQSGYVGIGTTSPTTALDVNGTINATGLKLGGNSFVDSAAATGMSGGAWYRVAQTTGTTSQPACSNFRLTWAGGSNGSVFFNACVTYSAGGNTIGHINILSQANDLSLGINALRVVYDPSALPNTSRAYVEYYLVAAVGVTVEAFDITALTTYHKGWTVLSPSTAGSIPGGFTSKQLVMGLGGEMATSGNLFVSGNVGIGTSTPSGKLDVTGGDIVTNNGYNKVYSNGAAANYNYNLMFYRSRGTFTAPTTTVNGDTLGGIMYYAYDGSAYTSTNSSMNGVLDGAVSAGTVPTALQFNTAGSERMRVASGGNVGIGTTTPGLLLDVNGPSGLPIAMNGGTQTGGVARFRTNQGLQMDIGSDNASPWGVWVQTTNTGNNGYVPLLLNPRQGNVGIGTTAPSTALDVNGQIKSVAISNGSTSIDFITGNLQYTSSSCGALTLNNLKSGGTYTLAVQGAAGGACSISAAYSGSGTTGPLTVKTGAINLTQTVGKHILLTFMVMNTTLYVTSVDGY